jgi:hypothetical protein
LFKERGKREGMWWGREVSLPGNNLGRKIFEFNKDNGP